MCIIAGLAQKPPLYAPFCVGFGSRADVAQLVEQLIRNEKVEGSTPFIGTNRLDRHTGSSPLSGDGHSLNTVNHTVPTALSQDSHAVILKIPEAVRPAREHFHFSVESLGDSV